MNDEKLQCCQLSFRSEERFVMKPSLVVGSASGRMVNAILFLPCKISLARKKKNMT